MIYDHSCWVIKDTQPFGFSDGYRGSQDRTGPTEARRPPPRVGSWLEAQSVWHVLFLEIGLCPVYSRTLNPLRSFQEWVSGPNETLSCGHKEPSSWWTFGVWSSEVSTCRGLDNSDLSCTLGPLGAFAAKPRTFPNSFFPPPHTYERVLNQ